MFCVALSLQGKAQSSRFGVGVGIGIMPWLCWLPRRSGLPLLHWGKERWENPNVRAFHYPPGLRSRCALCPPSGIALMFGCSNGVRRVAQTRGPPPPVDHKRTSSSSSARNPIMFAVIGAGDTSMYCDDNGERVCAACVAWKP